MKRSRTFDVSLIGESVKKLNPGVEFCDGGMTTRQDMIIAAYAPKNGVNGDCVKKAKKTRDVLTEKRSKTEDMNVSERRFYNECLKHDADHEIHIQPNRWFKLRGGNTYTPDFLEIDHAECKVKVHEVKGGYRGAGWEQGYERYKRAAGQYDRGITEFWMHEIIKGRWRHIRFRDLD